MKAAAKFFESKEGQYAILAIVGVAAFYIVGRILKQDLSEAANAIGTGASKVAEGVGGVISGHNTITAGSVYDGGGVFGTLGAATDSAAGGGLSALGEWFGGSLADLRDYFSGDPGASQSSSIQDASNKPYSTGPNSGYADAVDSSTVPASSVASPWAIGVALP